MDGAPTTRWFQVSDDLAAMAEAASSGAGPVTPRAAATVMLVRDAADDAAGDQVEVFMLRRRASMAFAPNRMVFPGGGVDERDADEHLPWAGPTPAEWAAWLEAEEREARELVVAAAREVFEECGVLLAGPTTEDVVGDLTGGEWDAEREGLLNKQFSFAEMLLRRGLVLRTDLMRPWAHWVTPEFERRRYDTRFFAARVPAGQRPDDRTSEADHADWVRPSELLADLEAGRAAMLPPTVVCVEQVAEARNVEEFLDSAPPMGRIMPTLERDGDVWRLRVDLPGESS